MTPEEILGWLKSVSDLLAGHDCSHLDATARAVQAALNLEHLAGKLRAAQGPTAGGP